MGAAAAAAAAKQAYDSAEIRDLIRRAQARDNEAFTALYQQNHSRVLSAVRRIIRDEDTADSVTNQAFIKVWQSLPGFAGESSLTTWVTRIGINEALMHLRREKRMQQPSLDDAHGIDLEALAVRDPDLAAVEDRQILDMAFGRVPFRHREMLRLRFVEGLEVREIMERTGKNKSAVKSGIFRARNMLKAELATLSK